MKTNAWVPPQRTAPAFVPAAFPVDQPCQMWGNGVGPVDLPLVLCMFKACELGRSVTPFLVQDENGQVLLELDAQGTLRGNEVLVDLFFRQASFFLDLRDRLIAEIRG